MFDEMDTNHDGYITKADLEAFYVKRGENLVDMAASERAGGGYMIPA
jgi:hypothetical protein